MGIHGIYKEIGPGRRIALSKFCVDHYVRHARPLRLAIDISIWLFQIQAGKGGANPALRTFYYRLLRLMTLNIHPLFVFDGPNKPPFKRHKRVGGPHVKVSSIPEFLAKQLLKQFAFPMHLAPGEAEAECSLLQNEGIVDAVLTEDVDALMFGSTVTMRHWTPEQKSTKVPTHVNVYDAHAIQRDLRLDKHGMILIALMSGGDYLPEGIPGCGPKTAIEAAKAGFGADLVAIDPDSDHAVTAYADWRQRLRNELHTNESKFFKQKRKALTIPDDFPDRAVLRYYTNPCVSRPDKLSSLSASLVWDKPLDLPSLRTFTAEAFDWIYLDGAKKFIRNMAPALLVRQLRLRAERACDDDILSLHAKSASEAKLVAAIHGKRTHPTTDNSDELRISFLPAAIVDIDLTVEEVSQDTDSPLGIPLDDEDDEDPATARGPYLYDPTVPEKVWIMDTFLRLGVPLMVQDWESSQRQSRIALADRQANKRSVPRKAARKAAAPLRTIRPIASYMRVMKPVSSQPPSKALNTVIDEIDLSADHDVPIVDKVDISHSSSPKPNHDVPVVEEFDLSHSFSPKPNHDVSVVIEEVDLSHCSSPKVKSRPAKRRSAEALSPASRRPSTTATPKAKRFAQRTIIDLLTPSPRINPEGQQARSLTMDDATIEDDLPDSVSVRRRRSPLRRHHTAPEDGMLPTPPDQPRATTPARVEDLEAIDLATPDRPTMGARGVSDFLPVTSRLCERGQAKRNTAAATKSMSPTKKSSVPKMHITTRESLEGSWKLVHEAEVVRVQANRRHLWRHSEVEVMDLTA